MKFIRSITRCEYATTNSDGYRTLEWEDCDWENSVVFVGDSHTFGKGMHYKDSFVGMIDEAIESPCINLGFPGAGPQINFLIAMLLTRKIKHLVMVWGYTIRTNVYKDKVLTTEFNLLNNITRDTRLMEYWTKKVVTRENGLWFIDVYESILKNHFSVYTSFTIEGLEKKFGDWAHNNKANDLALDGGHYGPVWNRRVADYILETIKENN